MDCAVHVTVSLLVVLEVSVAHQAYKRAVPEAGGMPHPSPRIRGSVHRCSIIRGIILAATRV